MQEEGGVFSECRLRELLRKGPPSLLGEGGLRGSQLLLLQLRPSLGHPVQGLHGEAAEDPHRVLCSEKAGKKRDIQEDVYRKADLLHLRKTT